MTWRSLILPALFVLWLVVNLWVLPKMGVPT